MTDPDRSPRPPIDWRAWLALAWAVWFGWLYLLMVIHERAPGVARALPVWIRG